MYDKQLHDQYKVLGKSDTLNNRQYEVINGRPNIKVKSVFNFKPSFVKKAVEKLSTARDTNYVLCNHECHCRITSKGRPKNV